MEIGLVAGLAIQLGYWRQKRAKSAFSLSKSVAAQLIRRRVLSALPHPARKWTLLILRRGLLEINKISYI